jgi:hypothetical protein
MDQHIGVSFMKSITVSKRIYQRSIPVFLVSFIIAVMVVQYLFAVPVIDQIRGEILTWANIVSLWVWLFANVILILNHSTRVMRAREDRRLWYESIIILATIAFFIIIAVSDPVNMEKGPTYTTIYKVLIGAIYLGAEASGITYQNYNVLRRLALQRFTPEVVVLLITCVFMWLRPMTAITYNYPWVFAASEWIEKVAYGSATRAATVVLAIGTLFLAIRALATKEPGIIEMEMA